MPRTAPAVNGTPDYVLVSFRYIDANGVKDAFNIRTTLARATNTVIEACGTALGAASNVNVYDIAISSVYTAGTASPSQAVEAPRIDARDVIETLEKDPGSGKTQYVYIPGPLDAIFIPTTNEVDIENALYTDVQEAFELLLPAAYNPVSVRFAQHKVTSQKTNL